MPNTEAQRALDILDLVLKGQRVKSEVFSLPTMIVKPDGLTLEIPDYGEFITSGGLGVPFKVVVNYRGDNGETWNEVYQTAKVADAYSIANWSAGLYNSRLSFLHPYYKLYSVRASEIGNSRNTAPVIINKAGTYAAVTNEGPDITGAAAKYAVYGLAGGYTFHFVRGLADSQINRNPTTGADLVPPQAGPLIAGWFRALANNQYGWLPRKKVDKESAVTQYNPITTVNGMATPGFATVICSNAILLPANGSLTISQADAKLLPGFNGTWTPVSSSGNTFVIRYQVANNAIIMQPKGRIRVYQTDAFNVFAPNQAYFDSFTTRRVKNSFTPSRRGRSARGIRTLA